MAKMNNIEKGGSRGNTRRKIGHCKRKNCLHQICISVAVLIIVGLSITLAIMANEKLKRLMNIGQTGYDTPEHVSSSHYRYAAVATGAKQCSRVGTDILGRERGSVMDACIATLLCLGVVHFQATGVGGGFLLTYYDGATKNVSTLLAREVAPLAAHKDMYKNQPSDSKEGGRSIAVPMEVAGYWKAHQRYGKLPWNSLFEPAIELAENGFILTEGTLLSAKAAIRHNISQLFDENGELKRAGDIVKLPLLATTLKRIAVGGAEEFYTGSLAHDIVSDIRDLDGIITMEDMRKFQHSALWADPIQIHIRNGDYTVFGAPLPSGSPIVAYIVNMLDGYNISARDYESDRYSLYLHRLTETFKFGFAKRAHLGDGEPVNTTLWENHPEADELAAETRKLINDYHVLPSASDYGNAPMLDNPGTAQVSIVGPDGSAVSVTGTINWPFGSGLSGEITGIIFNNEMDDFSKPPAFPANNIRPGKRPLSSMSPMIVLDSTGAVRLVVGASGGRKIITATADAIAKVLWSGKDLGWAVESPRTHHQLNPNVLQHEIGRQLTEHVIAYLEERGHTVKVNTFSARVQAVRVLSPEECRDSRCIEAASDSRKHGAPDGY